MKALSTTILIVVSAVVILIAALVVLTIFGGGMGQVSTLTQFKNNCIIQAKTTCSSFGAMPPTWDLDVSVSGTKTSCSKEVGLANCDDVCVQVLKGNCQADCLPQNKISMCSNNKVCCSQ
ncbi:MAG: hypothetical protein DRP13_00635 [Candidatus Aenigmatarchaeota archaeon]|nr:MAG: hypothetical protein DRP13_00635 [Candidatus Aenigmarchaeota archaeon]